MFSTVQLEIIQSLVPTLCDKGFDYYIAYTNSSYRDYNNYEPDLYIVFSKDVITANSMYSYIVSSGVKYSIRTNNFSTSSSAVNTDRISLVDFTGNLDIPVYEHIFTNSDFLSQTLIQPDINFKGGGEQLEKTNSIGLVCTALLLFVFFISIFRR